jgi:hexosaminidase
VLAAAIAAFGVGVGIGVTSATSSARPRPTAGADSAAYGEIVPEPVETSRAPGAPFVLDASTTVRYPSGSAATKGVALYLSSLFQPATGYALPITTDSGTPGISLSLTAADSGVGAEGYELRVTADRVTIAAPSAAGLFHGVETFRQLLPPAIDSTARQPYSAWSIPAGHVLDSARFSYRGAGLDIARHFFTIGQVERYIDEIARYKIDYLHLHLTDDQGWRIAIDGWPNLTAVGGATEVGGGAGGFYSQTDYRRLVAYAQSRFVTLIPEIDVPGHVDAALASYPRLSCTGKPTPVSTGIYPGFSSLCASQAATGSFLHDVFTQLAALTPGPYIGIGGDEASATKPADYSEMVQLAAADVRAAGKTPWGWQETTAAPVGPPSVACYWQVGPPSRTLTDAAAAGTSLVLMPADHAYLDQKYNATTALGLQWAGYVDVQDAYNWDPADYLADVAPSSVLGVEGELWTETVSTPADIDFLAFPRLPALAELGWSPAATHDWAGFRLRLAAQGPRWQAARIGFYASAQIPWPSRSRPAAGSAP